MLGVFAEAYIENIGECMAYAETDVRHGGREKH